MSMFKEQITVDLFGTFFNAEEFADEVVIGVDTLPVVFDEYALEKYNFKADGEGLTRGELLFYAPSVLFTKRPFRGQRLLVKNVSYSIMELRESAGVYTIVLEGMMS